MILQTKYKTLRNKVTSGIRKENIDFNNNRVNEANNESELWKIVNEVSNPKKENQWKIYIDGTIQEDETIIAQAFNNFFIQKIEKIHTSLPSKNKQISS